MNYCLKKVRKFTHEIPQPLLKWCTIVSVFLALMGLFGIEKLKEIPALGIADWAVTIDNLLDVHINGIAYPIIKVCIYFAACVFILLSICKHFMHRKAVVLKHSTFSNALSSYDDTILEGYNVQEFDIDLVNHMNDHNIVTAISRQDRIIKKLKNNCDEYTELFYYGIAHIPLIFRAGYQVGDEGQTRLLHKYRNETTQFKEISTDHDDYSIRFDQHQKIQNNDSREMLMVIATSFPVSSQDLAVFREKNMRCELQCEIHERTMYGVDSIESYDKMYKLKNQVLQEMRSMVAQYNIERIHLVLSTSSDFTFFLAESFSAYHDPEVVVYQYERTSAEKYPWGISNKAAPADAVIFNTFSTLNNK